MDTPISRAEHEEFRRTMDAEMERLQAEDTRLSKRLSIVEEQSKQINELALSVQKLAVNVENMCKIQARTDERVSVIEERDGDMWRQVVKYAVTAIVGLVIGYILKQIGM